jgi:hypothetical protein
MVWIIAGIGQPPVAMSLGIRSQNARREKVSRTN